MFMFIFPRIQASCENGEASITEIRSTSRRWGFPHIVTPSRQVGNRHFLFLHPDPLEQEIICQSGVRIIKKTDNCKRIPKTISIWDPLTGIQYV